MSRLNEIIIKIFKVKETEINDMMSPQTISNWDSFNYLMFISEIEDAYKIKFTINEVMDAKNLGDIKKYLKDKGADI